MQGIFYELYDRYKEIFKDQKKCLILNLDDLPLPRLQAEDRLTQFLTAFLENAIKYTSMGSTVILGAKKMNKKVYIYVSGSVPGADDELAGTVQGRYFKQVADKMGKTDEIDLSSAEFLIEKLKIKIVVKNKTRSKNEFGILIPA